MGWDAGLTMLVFPYRISGVLVRVDLNVRCSGRLLDLFPWIRTIASWGVFRTVMGNDDNDIDKMKRKTLKTGIQKPTFPN
jgi:hypothetical protein